MRYAEVPGIGSCSQLVLGTMALTPQDPEQAFSLLDGFVAMGGNTLDTAHVYGGGASERAIGAWLRRRGSREGLVIITKGAHPDRSGPRVTAAAIAADLAQSLERLGVDAVDIYMLHRDDPRLPVGGIMEALAEHVRSGRVRALGASNWSTARIEEANAYAAAHGLPAFACSSPNLSLAVPLQPRWPGCVSVGPAERAWHERTRLPLFSWSSQAGGFFTGRHSPDRPGDPEMARVYYTPENWERLRRAQELGRRHGVEATQIALAYVLHQPFPCFALIGPLNEGELRSSAEALAVRLTPVEMRWLNLEAEAC